MSYMKFVAVTAVIAVLYCLLHIWHMEGLSHWQFLTRGSSLLKQTERWQPAIDLSSISLGPWSVKWPV